MATIDEKLSSLAAELQDQLNTEEEHSPESEKDAMAAGASDLKDLSTILAALEDRVNKRLQAEASETPPVRATAESKVVTTTEEIQPLLTQGEIDALTAAMLTTVGGGVRTEVAADGCLLDLLTELSKSEPNRERVSASLSDLLESVTAGEAMPIVNSITPHGTFEVDWILARNAH